MSSPAVYSAAEASALYGVSEWAWYQSVHRGDCPAPVIRVGRRMVHPKAAVDRQLGIEPRATEQRMSG